MDLYIISWIHAAVVSLFSFYSFGTRSSDSATGLLGLKVCSFSLGYFIHDFVATRHEWLKYKSHAFHHLLAFGIITPLLMTRSTHLAKFYKQIGLLEISTVFLDQMWILRELDKENSKLYKANSLAFVVVFFLARIVYFPLIILHIFNGKAHQSELDKYGKVKWCFVPAIVLQYYWFGQIVQNLRKQ